MEALIEFLVFEKSFSEERVRRAIERMNASRGKGAQSRLDAFFTPSEKRKTDVKANTERVKSSKKQKTTKSKKWTLVTKIESYKIECPLILKSKQNIHFSNFPIIVYSSNSESIASRLPVQIPGRLRRV